MPLKLNRQTSNIGGFKLKSSTNSANMRIGSSYSLPFNPASLFSGGEAGFWLDPSDLSTLAQNSDGTGAVTVGDPVGYIADKSGNDNHATAPASGARPTLEQTVGGLYYLDFDGIDDVLLLGDILDSEIATSTGKWDAYAAAQYGGNGTLLSKAGDTTSQSENQRQYNVFRRTTSDTISGVNYTLTFSSLTQVQGGFISTGTDYVFRTVFDHELKASGTTANDTSRHKQWLNGASEALTVNYSGGNLGTIQNGTAQLSIGGRYGTSGPLSGAFTGRMYGLIMLGGVVKDDATADNVEAYLAGKSGVTL